MRTWIAMSLLITGVALAPPCAAVPPVPYHEIVDTVRKLAAQELGRKTSEVETTRSLFSQGLSENGLTSLLASVQSEFGVVFRDDDILQRKWNDPVSPLTVRRIAEMVSREMQETPPL